MDNSEDKNQIMNETGGTQESIDASREVSPLESTEPTVPTQSENSENPPSVSGEDHSQQTSTSSPPSSTSGDSAQPSHSIPPKPSSSVPTPPLKRRPRRTGQPLHILLQDCSKQACRNNTLNNHHILGYLCKKTPEEIKAIVSDKKALAIDLRNYSNEFVLTSARDRVVGEVDDQGKELLKDVDPEKDIIKQRFEDESSVFKSYDDAIHDIRVDLYFEGIKPRKQESDEGAEEAAARNIELNAVLEIWDQFHKRIDVEPKRGGRATQIPFSGRGGRPTGPPGRPHPYAPYRSPVPGPGPVQGQGPVPPHYAPQFAGPPPPANGPPFRDSRGHHRGYHERSPYREDYYPDRRDDFRRPDYDRRDPRDHPMDMRDMRDPRDFRDRPPPPYGARGDGSFGPGGRYDDRRRDNNGGPPRDNRHPGPNGAGSSPLVAHPSLPPRPQNGPYDGTSAPQGPHQAANPTNPMYPQQYPPAAHQPPPQVDPQANYNAYGQPQGYPTPGQSDYSGYPYAGYGQDPQQQAYAYSAASGWDMSGATAAPQQFNTSIQLLPFNANQPGRHKAVPLPTDFMSGPSDAPRLSMPEPHEILGTIRGVIIRDAQ
ncbi:hypothetical protein BGZ76_005436, partial [Entomortierella beljakovae]